MLEHLRPMLTRCVLLSFACVMAAPAVEASAAGMLARPKIITAPRFVPSAPGRGAFRGRELQRDQLAAHRFRGRRGGIGIGDGEGAYPVPVPVGGGDPSAGSSPAEGSPPEAFDAGYRAGPFYGEGPQIITLPDAPTRRSGVAHPGARLRAMRRPEWREEGRPPWAAPSPRQYAYRHHPRPSYGSFSPRYAQERHYAQEPRYAQEPSYAYQPSYSYEPWPMALAPCNEAPRAAIYNTPCGVRPYQ
jgi:hypothetical protein